MSAGTGCNTGAGLALLAAAPLPAHGKK